MFWFVILLCFSATISGMLIAINTGEVGIIYTWNEIQNTTLKPGLNFYNPISSRIALINILPQTDRIDEVECGTNDGLKIYFTYVEVGNRLPEGYVISTVSRYGLNYDKYLVTDLVRHQINVICSKKSAHEIAIELFDQLDDQLKEFIQSENNNQKSGLEINFVRLSKPRLPESIQRNYLELVEEKTRKKVVEEKKERTRAEKETELLIAKKDSEIAIHRADSENKKKLLNMRTHQEEQRIQNEITVETANANGKKILIEAKSLEAMHNLPGYVQIKMAEAISKNQKIYWGNNLPKMIYPNYNGIEIEKSSSSIVGTPVHISD